MSKEWVLPLLILVAGFLIGGVYSSWKNNSRVMAGVLAVAAALAIAAGAAWYFS
ncbi:MAG TPA: hypothetical protein VHW44_07640 [Pseudonocardiaceae bacterium]|nr:hypothetical protein [Pseudonocardiaceae bacterium]